MANEYWLSLVSNARPIHPSTVSAVEEIIGQPVRLNMDGEKVIIGNAEPLREADPLDMASHLSAVLGPGSVAIFHNNRELIPEAFLLKGEGRVELLRLGFESSKGFWPCPPL